MQVFASARQPLILLVCTPKLATVASLRTARQNIPMAHEFQKQRISDWHRSTLGSYITDKTRDVDTRDFTPSQKNSDLHFQVDSLKILLNELAGKGIQIEDQVVENDFGSFAWIHDPQGQRIELWEPAPWQNNLINLPEPD